MTSCDNSIPSSDKGRGVSALHYAPLSIASGTIMNAKLRLIALAVFASIAVTACGGGSSGGSTAVVVGAQPTALSKTDNVVGAGADAVAGKSATVTYTGYLYNDAAAGHKGVQFDTGSFSFLLGAGKVIPGFDQGVTGMKVGGKRTVVIPSSLGYGANGSPPSIPGNAGLVFDIELTAIN